MTSSEHHADARADHTARAAARCPITELLVDQCAHCRTPEAVKPTHRAHRPGPWFSATYGGECDHCGDPIVPGDTIRADGEGGWQCEHCGDDDD